MSDLALRADPAARVAGALDTVVASLPLSLAFAEGDADLVAVRATDLVEGLPVARGVLVVEPAPGVSLPEAPVPPVVVVVDRGAAGHPAAADLRDAVAGTGPTALLEVRLSAAPGTELDTLVLESLALVRSADAGLAHGRVIRSGAHGVTVRGATASGRAVLIDIVLTAARAVGAEVRAIGPTAAVGAHIPSAVAARPAAVTVSNADGARLLPTLWETAHRAAARRLRDAVDDVSSGGRHPSDLDELRDDLAVLHDLAL